MKGCDKFLADHTLCGKKVYKDNRCFPHWDRTVPEWYIRKLDRDLNSQLAHSPYVHSCPQVGVCYLHPNSRSNGRDKYVTN